MHIIVIVADTLRYDFLGVNGNAWIHTPELDAFSRRSFHFDRCYLSSFPTIPARTDWFTGRYGFPFTGWQPLDAQADILAQLLQDAGYVTQIITDNPHLMKDDFFFNRGFQGVCSIRGQEGDIVMTRMNHPGRPLPQGDRTRCNPFTHVTLGNTEVNLHAWSQYGMAWEEDRTIVQTCRTASRWLEENDKAEKFFLWLDCFDPHEPWDPPEYLVRRYDRREAGAPIMHPNYGPASDYRKRELVNMRAHYAAEVSLVSKWVGHVLRKIDDLGLFDNAVVVLMSDHGIYLGEHNRTGKSNICSHDHRGAWPMYQEITHIPLMIAMPAQRQGKRILEMIQPPDLMPTLLELAGIPIPEVSHGRSILDVMRGGRGRRPRRYAYSAAMLAEDPAHMGMRTTVTSRTYTLIMGGNTPDRVELYHLPSDPAQRRNLAHEKPRLVERMRAAMLRWLHEIGTDENKIRALYA